MLLNLFKVPNIETSNYFERARFALTWRICLSFSIVTFVIGFITFLTDDPFFEHYVAVFIMVSLTNLYMYRFKTYKLVSGLVIIGVSFAIISSLVFIPNAVHIIEAFYLIVITLFAYFTLGKKWGVGYTIFSIITYSIYLSTYFFENIRNLEQMYGSMSRILVVEYVFASLLITYIVFQFYDVNKYAEQNRKKAFDDLKKEKELVEKQNKEKTFLLQEIHHRVKNNLQVIISLLRIQSSELKNEESKTSFNEAINRIMTMSLVHQKMYEKDNLSSIDFRDYIESLIYEIQKSYSSKEVTVKTDIKVLTMNPKAIVTVALLINELLTNSIKHAFEETGEVFIAAHEVEEEATKFKIIFSDNGTWKEPKGNKSFGLQLIDIFVEQLDGNYHKEVTEQRTKYIFTLNKLNEDNKI